MHAKYLIIFLLLSLCLCDFRTLVYDKPGTFILTPLDYNNANSIMIELWSGGAAGNSFYGGGSGSYVNAFINTNNENFTLIVGKGGNHDPIDKSGGNGSLSSIVGNNINITLGGGLSFCEKNVSQHNYNNYNLCSNGGHIIKILCNYPNCFLNEKINGSSGSSIPCSSSNTCGQYNNYCYINTGNGGQAPNGGKGGCNSNNYDNMSCLVYQYSTTNSRQECFNNDINGTNGNQPGGGGGAYYIYYSRNLYNHHYYPVYPGNGGDGMIKIYYVSNCIPTQSPSISSSFSPSTSLSTSPSTSPSISPSTSHSISSSISPSTSSSISPLISSFTITNYISWYNYYSSLNIYDNSIISTTNNYIVDELVISLLSIIFCIVLLLIIVSFIMILTKCFMIKIDT